ncbi:MAG: phospho-N-acetylmuramoyl-pentapeptide-transferase [Clostridiales bacterium]|nr:phospho-N-acetylmuramoyl-pentapeptide-transferase [Clostridiales bacterium]
MKLALYAFLICFALSFILFYLMIPLLRRIKAGQPILAYVKEHESKGGTPTMGGLMVFLPSSILCLLFTRNGALSLFSVSVTLSYMIVGFLDDYIKIKTRKNEGLKPYQKILFQLVVAVVGAFFAYRNGITFLHLPFFNQTVFLGIWIIPLFIVAFLSITNSVNLTDGLDGLAGMVGLVYLIVMGIVISVQAAGAVSRGELDSLTIFSFATAGGILAFLCFNFHPAKIFMGDTGSMALGGLIGCVSMFSGNCLYMLVLGIMFVLSSISVIVQVVWYKRTKRRVFRMAPLHHHLQMCGMKEGKIAFIYATVTLLFGVGLLVGIL